MKQAVNGGISVQAVQPCPGRFGAATFALPSRAASASVMRVGRRNPGSLAIIGNDGVIKMTGPNGCIATIGFRHLIQIVVGSFALLTAQSAD